MKFGIKTIFFAFVLSQVSCVNPTHIPRSRLIVLFDSKIGQNLSSLNQMHDGLIDETSSYKEYVVDKNHPCSVIVRVNKQSNIIESWRFAPPDGCYE